MSLRNTLRSVWLWVAPLIFGGLLLARSQPSARVPIVVVLVITLLSRAWERVGTLTVSDDHRIRFEGEGSEIIRDWAEIALVVPYGRWILPWKPAIGLLVFQRPFWRHPVLVVPGFQEWLRPWAEAGVPVYGMSKSMLAAEKQGDDFFKRD